MRISLIIVTVVVASRHSNVKVVSTPIAMCWCDPSHSGALDKLEYYCGVLKCPIPPLDDVAEFIEARGRFSRLPAMHCTPLSLWGTVFEGDPLALLANMLTTLPCAQASAERVFSSASWGASDRERLSFTKLAREVFIRWNVTSLSAHG